MANYAGERIETVPVVVEIFTASGALGETFTFTGPAAYYPSGITELAYKDAKGNWVDFFPTKYTILAGGMGVKFVDGFQVAVGTAIRVTYLSPATTGGGGGGAFSIIRDYADITKLASVEMSNTKGSLYALLATIRRQNGSFPSTYEMKQLVTPLSSDMPHAFGSESIDGISGVLPEYQTAKGFRMIEQGGGASLMPGATYTSQPFNVFYANRIVGSLMHWFTDANPGELVLEFGNEPFFFDSTSGPLPYREKILLNTSNCDSQGLGIPPNERNRVRWSLERVGYYFRFQIKNNGAIQMPGMGWNVSMGAF